MRRGIGIAAVALVLAIVVVFLLVRESAPAPVAASELGADPALPAQETVIAVGPLTTAPFDPDEGGTERARGAQVVVVDDGEPFPAAPSFRKSEDGVISITAVLPPPSRFGFRGWRKSQLAGGGAGMVGLVAASPSDGTQWPELQCDDPESELVVPIVFNVRATDDRVGCALATAVQGVDARGAVVPGELFLMSGYVVSRRADLARELRIAMAVGPARNRIECEGAAGRTLARLAFEGVVHAADPSAVPGPLWPRDAAGWPGVGTRDGGIGGFECMAHLVSDATLVVHGVPPGLGILDTVFIAAINARDRTLAIAEAADPVRDFTTVSRKRARLLSAGETIRYGPADVALPQVACRLGEGVREDDLGGVTIRCFAEGTIEIAWASWDALMRCWGWKSRPHAHRHRNQEATFVLSGAGIRTVRFDGRIARAPALVFDVTRVPSPDHLVIDARLEGAAGLPVPVRCSGEAGPLGPSFSIDGVIVGGEVRDLGLLPDAPEGWPKGNQVPRVAIDKDRMRTTITALLEIKGRDVAFAVVHDRIPPGSDTAGVRASYARGSGGLQIVVTRSITVAELRAAGGLDGEPLDDFLRRHGILEEYVAALSGRAIRR